MPLRGQIMVRAAGERASPSCRHSCTEVQPHGLGARRQLSTLWFCFVLLAGVFFPASNNILLLGLPSFFAVVLFNLWHSIKAGYVTIFFHITGRFPSWLEDLSP